MRKITIAEIDVDGKHSRLSVTTEGFDALEALGAITMAAHSYIMGGMQTKLEAVSDAAPTDPPCQTC